MGRLLVIVMTLCVACGADPARPDATASDAAPPDAAVPDAFSCTSCVDPVPVCNEPALRCDQCETSPACAALPFTVVCVDGSCRECGGDPDCQGAALGPTCDLDRGYCRCAAPADCAGNPNGDVCDDGLGACTCGGDGDCVAPRTCQAQPYLGPGASTCQDPP